MSDTCGVSVGDPCPRAVLRAGFCDRVGCLGWSRVRCHMCLCAEQLLLPGCSCPKDKGEVTV